MCSSRDSIGNINNFSLYAIFLVPLKCKAKYPLLVNIYLYIVDGDLTPVLYSNNDLT